MRVIFSGREKKNKRLVGFTLVELLVVIAIISVLAGMLLPALEAAKDQATAITCQNMMKQRGLWGNFFETDYGYIMPCGINAMWQFWYYKMKEYADMDRKNYRLQAAYCPSDENPNLPWTDVPWPASAGNYRLSMLYNNYLGQAFGGFNPNSIKKSTQIPNPSVLGVIIGGNIDSSAIPSRAMPWMVKYSLGTLNAKFRHNMRSNVLYLDTHVSTLSEADILSMTPWNGATTLGRGNCTIDP